MEKKFYPDNFEQFLKEGTDDFRMYPSKRVWHSIYNDLHPSRKWPSLAIWILLISSIVYIGLSNKNQDISNKNQVAVSGNNPRSTSHADMIASVVTEPVSNSTINPTATSNNSDKTKPGDKVNPVYTQATAQDNLNTSVSKNDHKTSGRFNNNNNKQTNHQSGVLASLNKKNSTTGTEPSSVVRLTDKNQAATKTNIIAGSEEETAVVTTADINDLINNKKELDAADLLIKKAGAETKNKLTTPEKNNKADKEWIEDYAFHHKPFASKWKTLVSYQFYFTPSVGYRVISKNTELIPVSPSLVTASGNVGDYKEALSQSAAVNMEIGGNILYNISKNWNLKAGIQFNYTNYNINAYELKHPTMTTLTLNDLSTGLPHLDPRPTTLANISGIVSKKLNNNTYQVSLPLGADIKLAGKNNLTWYAGATIQPTYTAGGNAYLISSDLKNYVSDNSLIRNWNLNAGIETFVSYKTKGGLIINAGPQLRYQFLSTYSKQYTYTEKLYNVGLKIGIITKF